MTIPNFINNFCPGKCCLNSIAASAEHLCQYAEEYMGGLGAKSATKNFFRYFFGTSFYKYLHLSATFQKNELEGTSSGVIQSNNNRKTIIICDSGIQRIGYHVLYNMGVKIERDKSVKPLPTEKNGGDLKQYALPKGRRKGLI